MSSAIKHVNRGYYQCGKSVVNSDIQWIKWARIFTDDSHVWWGHTGMTNYWVFRFNKHRTNAANIEDALVCAMVDLAESGAGRGLFTRDGFKLFTVTDGQHFYFWIPNNLIINIYTQVLERATIIDEPLFCLVSVSLNVVQLSTTKVHC